MLNWLSLSAALSTALLLGFACDRQSFSADPSTAPSPGGAWRVLPLITNQKVDSAWKQVGGGRFVVDGETLRTESDNTGMGMLLYAGEKFGNCQLRLIFRGEKPASNSGVFVRIDDGILREANEYRARPNLSDAESQDESAKEVGPWYPVHHGFEVQIDESGDEHHRTGAIYSLAKAAPLPPSPPNGWRTMIITLRHTRVEVEVDGKPVCDFDSAAPNLPPRVKYYEPKREHRRPEVGYFGLQNHGPGDVVWFKEVSVRTLE